MKIAKNLPVRRRRGKRLIDWSTETDDATDASESDPEEVMEDEEEDTEDEEMEDYDSNVEEDRGVE
jgi:hypothetical protein